MGNPVHFCVLAAITILAIALIWKCESKGKNKGRKRKSFFRSRRFRRRRK